MNRRVDLYRPLLRLIGYIAAVAILFSLGFYITTWVGVERKPPAPLDSIEKSAPLAGVAPPPAVPAPTPAPAPIPAPTAPAPLAAPLAQQTPPLPPNTPAETAVPNKPAGLGTLIAASCPAAYEQGVRCRFLRVPANWDRPSPVIDIFVTVFPAVTADRRDDPLLILMGGPGQAGSDSAAALATKLANARLDRDIILVDQRGTGRSSPSLACRAVDPLQYWYGGITATDATGCLEPVRAAGFALEDFDTRQSANDLLALRRALGVQSWNILATSYGAILAQALMRIDGEAARSLVLNSPGLPGATWLNQDRLQAIQQLFVLVVQDCKAQPGCARTFPYLDSAVDRLAKELTSNPLTLRIRDRKTGMERLAKFNWADVPGCLPCVWAAAMGRPQSPAFSII
jgi:pimeloyl-ACP methyl ester carboxylesterase